MTTNYAELKEKVEAATPGPWEAINDTVENDDCQMIAHIMTSKYSATYKPDGSIEYIGDAVDAEFIAAFNPAVALELIARLERAEKELSALSDFLYTVERASDKGNLPYWMEDDYDSYVAAMKESK